MQPLHQSAFLTAQLNVLEEEAHEMLSRPEARAPNLIPHRFSELSAAGQVLVSTMHSVQFGRFEDLRVHDGDPVFDPPPRLIKVKRIGSVEEPTASVSDDWLLKEPIVDLLREFAALGNGSVERLEFRRGLPCLLEFAVSATHDSERDGARRV